MSNNNCQTPGENRRPCIQVRYLPFQNAKSSTLQFSSPSELQESHFEQNKKLSQQLIQNQRKLPHPLQEYSQTPIQYGLPPEQSLNQRPQYAAKSGSRKCLCPCPPHTKGAMKRTKNTPWSNEYPEIVPSVIPCSCDAPNAKTWVKRVKPIKPAKKNTDDDVKTPQYSKSSNKKCLCPWPSHTKGAMKRRKKSPWSKDYPEIVPFVIPCLCDAPNAKTWGKKRNRQSLE